MFCPVCKCEFRKGFVECKSCQVALVEDLDKIVETVRDRGEKKKSISELAQKAMSKGGSVSLSNNLWRSFGFPKRPQYGNIWNFFRARWLVGLERRLFGELVFIGIATHITTGILQPNHIDEITIYLAAQPNAIECVGCATEQEMHDAITSYGNTAPSEWPKILSKRLKVNEIEDDTVLAGVLAGCALFSNTVDLLIQMAKEGR